MELTIRQDSVVNWTANQRGVGPTRKGGVVKKSFVRAAVAALVVTPVSGLGFWLLLTHDAKSTGLDTLIFTTAIAALLGCAAGAIGAVVTFAFSQYPVSSFCENRSTVRQCPLPLFTGMNIYSSLQDAKAADASFLFFIWLLVWPISFLVSLWVDLQHFAAKTILTRLKKK
jgi:hypothetical protein